MSKYEELKEKALCRVLGYRQKLEVIKKQINETNCEDSDRLFELSDDFRAYLYDLQEAEAKYTTLINEEQKISQMLEGFYDDGVIRSFIYTDIYKTGSFEYYRYRVKYSYFKTLEEAKEYSISLGENKDWLENAYVYL